MNENIGQRYDSIRFSEIKGIVESADTLSQSKVDELSNELRSMTLGLDERSQIASIIQKANSKIGSPQYDFGSNEDLLDDFTTNSETVRRPGALVAVAILFFIQALGGLLSLIGIGSMFYEGMVVVMIINLLFTLGTITLRVIAGIGLLNMTKNAWKFSIALLIGNAGSLLITGVSFAMLTRAYGPSVDMFDGVLSVMFVIPILMSILSIIFLVMLFGDEVKDALRPTSEDKTFAFVLGLVFVLIPLVLTVIQLNEM